MRAQVLASLLILWSCGCQTTQVARNVVAISGQSRYVDEQQVLNNLAMLAANPEAIPCFAVMLQGQDQIARTAQITYTPNLDLITAAGHFVNHYVLDKQSLGIQGTKQNQESIQVAPVNDPDKLLLIQAAFHKALGIADPYQDALDAALKPIESQPPPPTKIDVPQPFQVQLVTGPAKSPDNKAKATFGKPQVTDEVKELESHKANWQHYDQMIATGWFCIAKKKDVPKHACLVGSYCDTYVYVLPGREAELSRLAFVILHIASLDLSKLVLKQTPRATDEPSRVSPLAPPRIQTLPFMPTLPSPSPT